MRGFFSKDMNTTKHWTRLVLILLFCLNVQAQQEGKTGKRVLFIGDSITDGGWGRSGGNMLPSEKRNQKDQNHLLGHSFVFLCAAHFQSEYPEADYVFLNRGISGNTLEDLKERWQKDATELHPDVISLLVGTNDVDKWLNDHAGMDFDIKAWGQDYRHLLS